MLTQKTQTSYLQGYTLIELLVTMAIAGILMGIGIPSFTSLIQNNRLTTNANLVISSLNFARSESIKRGVNVYISRKGSVTQNWDSGWNVYLDLNADEVRYDAANDTLLKTYDALGNGFTLRTGANYDDWVAYTPEGLTISSGIFVNDTFLVCAPERASNADTRQIAINVVGRPSVSNGLMSDCP